MAKWVELPDCVSGVALGAAEIVLSDDLSNAGIATCKVYYPPVIPDPNDPNSGISNSQLDTLTGQGAAATGN